MSDLPATLDPECPGCRALVALLEQQAQQAEQQAQRISLLEAKLAELSAKLGQNSGNSHQPPSSDAPGKPRPAQGKREKTGRSRGGQKGHKGHTRDLAPPEQVTEHRVIAPPACRCCGTTLAGTDPTPRRHQVLELPPIVPLVIEYQLHTLSCSSCGAWTAAELPQGVSAGAFGPRLSAAICTLTAHYRLSKAKTREFLADVLGLCVSTSAICRVEARMAAALAQPVAEAQQYVQQQEVVYIDETGWRQGHKLYWLWAVVTQAVVVFAIRPTRSSAVAKELLGAAFDGTAVSDRFSGYKWLHALLRQLCWAHLIRDFRKMAQVQDEVAAAIGQRLGESARKLFALWARVKAGTLARSTFRTNASKLRIAVRETLEQGAGLGHETVSGMCRELLRTETSMWTFVRVEGVEPTNNEAEHEVRHGVLYRKISLGTQSERGSRFVERMLTVRASLRRQNRNVFAYLVDTADAANHGIPPPSLLPDHTLAV